MSLWIELSLGGRPQIAESLWCFPAGERWRGDVPRGTSFHLVQFSGCPVQVGLPVPPQGADAEGLWNTTWLGSLWRWG